jgi:uncharacterized protein Veg
MKSRFARHVKLKCKQVRREFCENLGKFLSTNQTNFILKCETASRKTRVAPFFQRPKHQKKPIA